MRELTVAECEKILEGAMEYAKKIGKPSGIGIVDAGENFKMAVAITATAYLAPHP